MLCFLCAISHSEMTHEKVRVQVRLMMLFLKTACCEIMQRMCSDNKPNDLARAIIHRSMTPGGSIPLAVMAR